MAPGDFLCYAEMDAFLRSLVVKDGPLGRTGTVTWPSGRVETVRIHSVGRLSQLTPETVKGCKTVAWLTTEYDDGACLYVHVNQPDGTGYGGSNSTTKGVKTFYTLAKEDPTREEDLARCTDW